MALYQLTTDGGVLRTSDNVFIPMDDGNLDFQAFSQWIAEGNIPANPTIPPPPTTISVNDFVNRFTQLEQVAVQTACMGNAQLTWGLTLGLAKGEIDLTSLTLQTWMGALIQAGAVTQPRATEIMTP